MADITSGIVAANQAALAGDTMGAIEAAREALLSSQALTASAWERCDALTAMGPVWSRCFSAEVLALVAALSPESGADDFTAVAERVSDTGRHGIAGALYAMAASADGHSVARWLAATQALDAAGEHATALAVLEQCPPSVVVDPSLVEARAWQALLSRDVASAQEFADALDPQRDGAARLQAALARAQTLGRTGPLAVDDLRAWHMVMTGGVLLRVAPGDKGDGSFNGRFAAHQDGPSVALEAVRKVAYALGVLDMTMANVFFYADWPSAVLAHAIGKVFGRMPKALEFPCAEPGLIVVNDLEVLTEVQREALAQRHPQQVLWNHAACHTRNQALAGDFTTFLCAVNDTPWKLAADGAPPMNAASPFDLAEGVSTATLYDNALADLPSVINLCRRLADGPASAHPSLLLEGGVREPQLRASPVPRRQGRTERV